MLADLMDVQPEVEFLDFASFFGVKHIDQQDSKGKTMLHYSASRGDNFIVNLLLEAGACTKLIDRYQFSPYGLAVREDNFDTALLILQKEPQIKGAGTFGSLLNLAVTKL